MDTYQAMRPAVQTAVDGVAAYLNGGTLSQISLDQLPDLQKGTMLAWVSQKSGQIEGYDDQTDYRILLGPVDSVVPVTRGRGPESQTWYEVTFGGYANVGFSPSRVSDQEVNSLGELVHKIQDDTEAPLTLGNARVWYVAEDATENRRTVNIPGDRENGYVGILHEDAKTHLLPLVEQEIEKVTRRAEVR
tara:strand:- start:25 stop:594 length:570 start_codon:yes stop_codon:yes gene_type:complete